MFTNINDVLATVVNTLTVISITDNILHIAKFFIASVDAGVGR